MGNGFLGYARGASPQAVTFWAFSPGANRRTEDESSVSGEKGDAFRCFGILPNEDSAMNRAVGAWEESGVTIPGALPAGWYELGLWPLRRGGGKRTEDRGQSTEGGGRKQKGESRNPGGGASVIRYFGLRGVVRGR